MAEASGVRVTATLTHEQHRVLRELSEKHGVSVAWLVRHALERFVKEGGVQLPLNLGQ